MTPDFLNAGFSVTPGSSPLKQGHTTDLTYQVTSADSTENFHSTGKEVMPGLMVFMVWSDVEKNAQNAQKNQLSGPGSLVTASHEFPGSRHYGRKTSKVLKTYSLDIYSAGSPFLLEMLIPLFCNHC